MPRGVHLLYRTETSPTSSRGELPLFSNAPPVFELSEDTDSVKIDVLKTPKQVALSKSMVTYLKIISHFLFNLQLF